MRVALLYNPRPPAPDPALPDDFFDEYDTPETIGAIRSALEGLHVQVVPVEAGRRLPWRLEEGCFDFVFNIAEGSGRRCREAIPAAVCELLEIPFTGSDALTLAATLDKSIARRIVSPEVPVARAVLVEGPGDEPTLRDLSYPVVVKPSDEGSSKGIRAESLCRDAEAAAAGCRWLRDRYGSNALAEEFLPGAEVTAAVRGNGARAEILGMMQIDPCPGSPEPFLYSSEVKRDFRRRVRYSVPPNLPEAVLEAIRGHALAAFRLLGCRDIARMDFRLDAASRPVFLECNPLPGLNPDSSDLVILSRGILPYEELVQGILLDAAERTGVQIA